MLKRKVLDVNQIYTTYGYKPNTLKYFRNNPDANGGDVPSWFPIGNRPHYPEDQFDAWHNKQLQKASNQKSSKEEEQKSEIGEIGKIGKRKIGKKG